MSRDACDPQLQALIGRLEEWAAWYSRQSLGGLGYPSASLEYRVLLGGKSSTRTYTGHAAAEEIETWVCEMATVHPEMARALRGYYFYPGSLRTQALRLQMSHTQVSRLVQRAQHWLAGRSANAIQREG